MEINKGDIWYIEKRNDTVGHEQWSGRPAVIVSSDEINRGESAVEVVYLTSQPKRSSPYHVVVEAAGRISTALCEQIWTIDTSRLQNRGGKLTGEEMRKIEVALLESLDIQSTCAKSEETAPASIDPDKEIWKAKFELIYKEFKELLERVVG